MFQIFKELTERIQDKKEQPDKNKEKLTFEEFAELFQQCPIPQVEYTKHFEAFIQTLEVEDEGFKEDLKKCYALCSYRLDRALRPKNPELPQIPKAEENPEEKPEAKPEVKLEEKPEAKPEEKPQENPEPKPEVKLEEKPEAKPDVKMTGGSHIPACITSIRLKTIASKKRDDVFREITG
jgi:hypothetical protein